MATKSVSIMSTESPLFRSPSEGGGGSEGTELAMAVGYDQRREAFELRINSNGAKPTFGLVFSVPTEHKRPNFIPSPESK